MTGNGKRERSALDRLADAFVDDILNTSDEDILAEFQETHGDPEQHAEKMRVALEAAILKANKQKLVAARAAVAADRQQREGKPNAVIDMEAARTRLQKIMQNPAIAQQLTMAARKESEMSDSDIIDMLNDLRELGIINSEDDEGKNG